jgi:hypothetical protein
MMSLRKPRKWLLRPILAVLAGWGLAVVADVAQIDQNAVLYSTQYEHGVNLSSFRGVPGKGTSATPPATDGRAPVGGTAYQFQGIVTYGAVVIPQANATLQPGQSFERNAAAANLNLPRGTAGNGSGEIIMVLRASQAGGSTFSQPFALEFGSVIAPPATDENGVLLTTSPTRYWEAQPYTNSTSPPTLYYFSPNARQVFATVPGSVQVTWRRRDPGVSSGYTNKVTIGGLDYALTNAVYIVSGAPVKTPRKIFWTQKSFAATGRPVAVSPSLVGAIYFAYNPAFPPAVAAEYSDGSAIPGAGELRTLWYDSTQGSILAYNAEGRAFMELLGDVQPSGAREFLGYEIVDVIRQPVSQPLTAELGERISAHGSSQSDANLTPAPLQATLNGRFLYQDASGESGRIEYYAAAETRNVNDVLVHWLETGVAGLKWPLLYIRYQQIWPEDPARYSHYLRPPVATAGDALATAVQLSSRNVPTLQYQDSLDYPRAFLNEKSQFYTFLDTSQPQHRTLLRFSSGTTVAFERVMSTLSTNLFRGTGSSVVDIRGDLPRPGRGSHLKLDGGGWGQLPAGVYFNGGSYTIECWVNTPTQSQDRLWERLIDFGNGPGQQNVLFALSSNPSGRPNVTHYTPTGNSSLTANNLLPMNQWVHLAAVFDVGTSTLTIYLNDVLVGSQSGFHPPDGANRLYNFVGKSNWPDPLAMASLDSLRIWSTARTSEQLAMDMQAGGYPAGTSGLVAQFTFDEAGPVAYDSSGNGHHMTLYGTAASSSGTIPAGGAPRYLYQTAYVGDRINSPAGELGSTGDYLAGYILQSSGTSFHPKAYIDPFAAGFTSANAGAIIPVNAIPGANLLEVWWFRQNATNAVKNQGKGFDPIYWPSVIGRYQLAWPDNAAKQIVLAANAGSGGLPSLQAKGSIYTQNDPARLGYNPNEEHALMIGGQAYALRDDLNVTSGSGFSSMPYVLLDYTEQDGRPAMRAFKVQRENPAAGQFFDYVVEAGKQVQAPMPLPILPPPLQVISNKIGKSHVIYTTNYNFEVQVTNGDLPAGWSPSEASGPFGNYPSFTYRDRKNGFWVVRGLHSGLPPLAAGTYSTFTPSNDGFTSTVVGGGLLGSPSTNYIHTSRRIDSLIASVSAQTPLPDGITFGPLANGLALYGIWTSASSGPYLLNIADADGSQVQVSFWFNNAKSAQDPLILNGFTGRPPQLAQAAARTNSFAMSFYYKTQDGFAWPNRASPPPTGTIVPYLRPPQSGGGFQGSGDAPNSPALSIVYRPVWPGNVPSIAFGETLTVASRGRPAIRGQSSVSVLYQQSVALAAANRPSHPAVTLHDPTRQKTFLLATDPSAGLSQLPAGVYAQGYQGKTFFPNLPPHLASRFYFDPTLGPAGALVFKGEFHDDPVGEKYLQLNILAGSDLRSVKALCPSSDPDIGKWNTAIDNLTTTVETFYENPEVPGQYIVNTNQTVTRGVGELVAVTDRNTAVDGYALSAAGPGQGYVTLITGNGSAFTPANEPVSVYILRVAGSLYAGEVKVIPDANPLSELVTFEHTGDLAGRTADYEYEWKIAPPVDGFPPLADATMSRYQALTNGANIKHYTLGNSGVASLADNWLVLRYRPTNPSHPLYNQWSAWTAPQFAEGYVKRVLAGVNPFNQRTSDLNNNAVNTGASMLTQAGKRYEGDIALNQDTLNDYGLIEIYETVLNRARNLSINAGINYGPANDSLLLAAGYLSDLYKILGDEAYADADNPTIGIGTKDNTYGDIATSLFSFQGQVATLADEELALLAGRDDVAMPGVQSAPVYNRLVWNYTGGINSGQTIYALNYNILDQNLNGSVDAADASILYPQGHGDAYGHYLTALKGYHSLLMNPNFDWVPRVQSVSILGVPVTVGYMDERKFAAAAAAVARTGRQVFDLNWRKAYVPGQDSGWGSFANTRLSNRTVSDAGVATNVVRQWGMDQWASRTGQGALINWVVGNAILPDVDPDPSHEGIQKVDRTTVPELSELVTTAADLQAAMDNAEGRLSPLGVSQGSVAFDLNPALVVGANPQTHFEQVYERTKLALNNAVAAFNDAKDITRLMRSEGDSLADIQAQLSEQELTFNNALIEVFGTPYPDDRGPGRTYKQDYAGPDLYHYMYVETPELTFPGIIDPTATNTYRLDVQGFPESWLSGVQSKRESFDFVNLALDSDGNDLRGSTDYIEYTLNPHGYFAKPSSWTGKRQSPGQLQQAISEVISARAALLEALDNASGAKGALDGMIRTYKAGLVATDKIEKLTRDLAIAEQVTANVERASQLFKDVQDTIASAESDAANVVKEAFPLVFIAGLADGGDLTSVARASVKAAELPVKAALDFAEIARLAVTQAIRAANDAAATGVQFEQIDPTQQTEDRRSALNDLEGALGDLQGANYAINQALQHYDDAQRKVTALVAKGQQIQQVREVARKRAAAVIQGFSSRDAAFRLFRSEKLERYKTLFDLTTRYALLAANAYDYETGLLGTDQGRSFISRIVNSRALGVVRNGEPQFAGSNTGDPGISSALAEMKADFDVLKGRLGFNSPDVYTTLASIRTGHLRILPDTNGIPNWQDFLQRSTVDNILADSDVSRYCQQVDQGNRLPVPGIILSFSTTITPGQNLFGQTLSAGDPSFHRSYFATKINSVGVAFEGYRGMNLPGLNSTTDPNLSFLDPLALAANPYVYLIPVGVDTLRSPPLGDASQLRQWRVDDIAIPLPFNIGGSGFSTKPFYNSSDSLTEPLFTLRKHQAFRPVDSAAVFSGNPYNGTSLQFSQFTNRRLIGRSVWNSQWKLVIPADSLLSDPKEGLNRFIQTVSDIKLYFTTYSYSGN